ncbi:MAG: hypothetical protein ACLTER_12050 [Ruminococcus sp.]
MMKKTKMFMLVLTSAVLALTPVTANAAEAAPSQVTETVIATPSPTPKSHRKRLGEDQIRNQKILSKRKTPHRFPEDWQRIISISVPREPY